MLSVKVKKFFALWLGFAGFCWSVAHAADSFQELPRTWTNNQGRTVQAIFAGEENDQVVLNLGLGGVAKVPLSNLSKADQDYLAFVRLRAVEAPASFPARVELKVRSNFMYPSELNRRGDPPSTVETTPDWQCETYAVGPLQVQVNWANAPKASEDQRAELFHPLLAADWFLRNLPGLPKRDLKPGEELPEVLCVHDWQFDQLGGQAKRYWVIRDGRLVLPTRALGIAGNFERTDAEEPSAVTPEQRQANVFAGAVRWGMAEDAMCLPRWVREGLVECARLAPQEKGWPQPARLFRTLSERIAFWSRGDKHLSAAQATEVFNLPEAQWSRYDSGFRDASYARYMNGALLLVFYYLYLDPEAQKAWQEAWALAHEDGTKIRAYFTGRRRFHHYEHLTRLVFRADGTFAYPPGQPPPQTSPPPFPELAADDFELLAKRHVSVLERPFAKGGLEKVLTEAYARAGMPLDAAAAPSAYTFSAAASKSNGSVVQAGKRLPVDNRTWPLQIKVGLDAVLAFEVKDPTTRKPTNRYRCGRFEFKSDVPLTLPVVQEMARTFTAVEQLMKQLPWGITPKPAEGSDYFEARLFSTRRAYEDDGGPRLSGGVYSRKDKIFRVPFASLGIVRDKDGQWVKAPGYSVTTIVHELTHMMMDEMLMSLPIWIVEGSAEYTEMIPFKDGLFRFGDHQEGLKTYAAKFASEGALPSAEDCVTIFHQTVETWHSSVFQGTILRSDPPGKPQSQRVPPPIIPGLSGTSQVLTQHRLYCAATLLFYYFMHLDEPKRGHPMLPFMDAVQDDLPQMRGFIAAEIDYEHRMSEFLKKPGVELFPDGRFTYPSELTPPERPRAPGGALEADRIGFIHLDTLAKGRSDAQLAAEIRKKYQAMGIKL